MKKLVSIFFIGISLYLFSEETHIGLNEMDPNFNNLELLISHEEILNKIQEVATKINQDYKGKELQVIMIMKGAICFTSDFIKELKVPFHLDFIQCSSYGKNGSQRGELTVHGIDKIDVKSKNVLIVDDILDSGNTLNQVKLAILKKEPASVKSLILLLKETTKRDKKILDPDYYLFTVQDQFVIGYGLDYKEYFRGLKGIYVVK